MDFLGHAIKKNRHERSGVRFYLPDAASVSRYVKASQVKSHVALLSLLAGLGRENHIGQGNIYEGPVLCKIYFTNVLAIITDHSDITKGNSTS